MAKSEDLSTDWQRSAGDFSCSVCRRKRLPASEFSKSQVDKALASLNTIPDKDIRTGPDLDRVLFLTAVCKKCSEEREEKEREEARAKREAREQAAEEAVLEPPERVSVSLAERPFGMTPSKAEGVGYLVTKTSEGKPAARAGVRPGWRVAEVTGQSCEGLDLEAVQALLKAAELPVAVVFEKVPGGAEFCTACQRVLPAPLFSRKMRTRPPDKRRCSACVEAADGAAEAEAEAAEGAAPAPAEAADGKPQSKLAELRELCAGTAREAEQVTGIRAVRGGSRGGRGRGGRR